MQIFAKFSGPVPKFPTSKGEKNKKTKSEGEKNGKRKKKTKGRSREVTC